MIVHTMTQALPKLDYLRLLPFVPEKGSLTALSIGYQDRGLTAIFDGDVVIELTRVCGDTVTRSALLSRRDIDLAWELG